MKRLRERDHHGTFGNRRGSKGSGHLAFDSAPAGSTVQRIQLEPSFGVIVSERPNSVSSPDNRKPMFALHQA
jgi:hypothetical protein